MFQLKDWIAYAFEVFFQKCSATEPSVPYNPLDPTLKTLCWSCLCVSRTTTCKYEHVVYDVCLLVSYSTEFRKVNTCFIRFI